MTEVWLILPPKLPSDQEPLALRATRKLLARKTSQRGLKLEERHAIPAGTFFGRRSWCLEPGDAMNLYARANRTQVCVFMIREVSVLVDPSKRSATEGGQLLGMRRYVRYKAFVSRISPGETSVVLDGKLDAFADWCSVVACDGENDPRCLPLHVFDSATDQPGLSTAAGRADFQTTFGAPGHRVDSSGFRWQRAAALHGRDQLRIAGQTLATGFHWDVTRAKRGTWLRLCTSNEVWEVQGGHVNVYPDSHIRGADADGSRRVWTARTVRPGSSGRKRRRNRKTRR